MNQKNISNYNKKTIIIRETIKEPKDKTALPTAFPKAAGFCEIVSANANPSIIILPNVVIMRKIIAIITPGPDQFKKLCLIIEYKQSENKSIAVPRDTPPNIFAWVHSPFLTLSAVIDDKTPSAMDPKRSIMVVKVAPISKEKLLK